MLDTSTLPSTGFIRLDGILQLIPVSKSTWWNWVNDGRAPPAIRLSDNITVWRLEDIHALIGKLGKPVANDAAAPRLVGPGPRLDGVSLARFMRMRADERAELIENWKRKASAMIDTQALEQRRLARRFLARVHAWERIAASGPPTRRRASRGAKA